MRQADAPKPEESRQPGADDQAEIYGILSDLDMLEELIEDLDEFGFTTREQVLSALAEATEHVGERTADARISILENVVAAMDEFEATSREDIIAKMAYIESQANLIDAGERDLEDL